MGGEKADPVTAVLTNTQASHFQSPAAVSARPVSITSSAPAVSIITQPDAMKASALAMSAPPVAGQSPRATVVSETERTDPMMEKKDMKMQEKDMKYKPLPVGEVERLN